MKNLKFATLPFITDIPQAVAFLVFLGIASSIRESMSSSDKCQTWSQLKPWCNDSGVLNLLTIVQAKTKDKNKPQHKWCMLR